jgi:hypothetical protein
MPDESGNRKLFHAVHFFPSSKLPHLLLFYLEFLAIWLLNNKVSFISQLSSQGRQQLHRLIKCDSDSLGPCSPGLLGSENFPQSQKLPGQLEERLMSFGCSPLSGMLSLFSEGAVWECIPEAKSPPTENSKVTSHRLNRVGTMVWI